MNIHTSLEPDDPTIDNLLESDRRLAILCDSCGRFRYMKSSRYAGDQKVSDLGAKLTCSACCSKNVRAIAVSRNAENGYWPAERS